MGGKVAQLEWIASRKPTGLCGLVLVLAPEPPAPLIFPSDMAEQQLQGYDSTQNAEYVVRNVLSRKLSDEDVALTVSDCFSGTRASTVAWPTYASREDVSGDMDISTLVLVGEFDVVEPVERVKEPVVERIPGARLKVLDNIGHLLPLEVPTEVAAQVDCFMQSFCS